MSIKVTVMDRRLEKKLSSLRERIRKLDSALVAFSGGVDSSFLMRICREELGEKAVAVTALSESYPRSELSVARRVAKIIGVKHVVVDSGRQNADVRSARATAHGCNVYSTMKGVAMRMRIKHVIDGSHRDDASEKGESFINARNSGIRSPLLESNLSKAEIRLLAKELKLPNWDKPASSDVKGKARKAAKKPAFAKGYLFQIAPTAKLQLKGETACITAGKRSMVSLARRIGTIRKRMKSFGFSEVMLRLSS
ncbi:MAG: asparagine synthase-related protein [Candidatus Micrarchaeota archaeon]